MHVNKTHAPNTETACGNAYILQLGHNTCFP